MGNANGSASDVSASLDLSGLRAAVIGGTGGIGRALARRLAARGAQVTVVGRTFRDEGTPRLDFIPADLALMREARHLADRLPAEDLDLVVFTTGVMAGPRREETAEGLERDLAVSYLSRLVILRAIAPRLGTGRPAGAPPARVFVMGFPGRGQKAKLDDLNSERSYGWLSAQMNTVAGNEALVLDATERYPHLDVFGLNPGFVRTGIRRNLFGAQAWLHRLVERLGSPVMATADDYAARIVPLLVSPAIAGRSGTVFDRRARTIAPSRWLDAGNRKRLIETSETLLARLAVEPSQPGRSEGSRK